MAKSKLTPRQEEIMGLMKGQPGITANEIAATMETTPQAVYQQISRLRKLKVLPPKKAPAKRKATAKAINNNDRSTPPAIVPPPTAAPALSLEGHVAEEMTTVVTQLAEARALKESATAREAELVEYEARLVKAQEALAA